MNQYQVPILPEYKSMYVDMGLSEIATIERERYDKASAENDQLTRTMGSIRLLNGDKQVIKDAEDRVRTMIGSSGKFQFLKGNVDAAVTDFATDRDMADAMDSKAVADKEDAYANELRAQGKEVPLHVTPKIDPLTGQVVRDGNGNVVMVKASDVHNTKTQGIYGTKVQEKLDYNQRILQMIGGIAESGSSTISEGLLAKGLTTDDVGTWVRTGGSGVSQTKKDDIADLLVDEFLLSPEGNQLYNIKTKLEVNSKDMLKSDKEARAEIQKHIRDLGQKQVGWKENAQKQIVAVPEIESGAYPSELPAIESLYVPPFSKIDMDMSKEDKEKLYDSTGKYNPAGPKNASVGIKAYYKKIQDEISAEVRKEGGLGNIAVDKYATRDLLKYLHDDPTIKVAFPKRDKQTDEAWGREVLNAHRGTVKVINRGFEDMPALAGSVLSKIRSSKVYSDEGTPYDSLDEYLSEENKLLSAKWKNRDSVIKKGLLNGLNATMNSSAKGVPVSAHIVTGGNPKLVGKVNISFTTEDGEDYSIYVDAPSSSTNSFKYLEAIAQAQKAKTVGKIFIGKATEVDPNTNTPVTRNLYIDTSVKESSTIKNQRTFAVNLVEEDELGKVQKVYTQGMIEAQSILGLQQRAINSTGVEGRMWRSVKVTGEKAQH